MENKNNVQPDSGENKRLTFIQTLQLGFYGVPEFRKGLVYIAIGVLIVFATRLFAPAQSTSLVSLLGCFVSFAGFDHISKIMGGLRDATWDDYQSVVIERNTGGTETE